MFLYYYAASRQRGFKPTQSSARVAKPHTKSYHNIKTPVVTRREDMDLLLLLAVPVPPPDLSLLGQLESERDLETPFGKVTELARRRIGDRGIWVLPYFGKPDRTDPRASIWAAREIGARWVVGWESVLSLSDHLIPGDNLIPHDYIDLVKHHPETPCTEGSSAAYATPFCPEARSALMGVLPSAFPRGVYLAVDEIFPETPAEARAYRALGGDVIGANLVPEAAIAREAGLCFAAVLTVFGTASHRRTRVGAKAAARGLRRVLEALSTLEMR
jgi:5'-methylthioadenosine phosphorylase